MSDTSVKVAIAFVHGLGHACRFICARRRWAGRVSAATGHFAAGRLNGSAMVGLDPGLNPSQNMPKAATIPPPRISVPTVPQFQVIAKSVARRQKLAMVTPLGNPGFQD